MIKINSIKVVTEFVDTETGEITKEERVLGEETKKEKKPRTSKKPKDDDPTPKVTLLDNKLQFNKAAVELTGFEPEDKILIEFEKKGRVVTPLISKNLVKGNRLTKTYTVSFRGKQHDELSEYGDTFEIISIPDRDNIFKLKGNAAEKEDDIIDLPEEIENPEEIEDELNVDSVDTDDIDFNFGD